VFQVVLRQRLQNISQQHSHLALGAATPTGPITSSVHNGVTAVGTVGADATDGDVV
jgi:hypothetical protein